MKLYFFVSISKIIFLSRGEETDIDLRFRLLRQNHNRNSSFELSQKNKNVSQAQESMFRERAGSLSKFSSSVPFLHPNRDSGKQPIIMIFVLGGISPSEIK